MLNAQLNYLCLVSFCVRIIRHMHRCLNISYSVFSLLVEQVIAVCAWACFNVSLHFTTGHGDCFPRTGRGSQPSLTPSLQKQCFAALVYHCWSPLIAVGGTTPPTHAHQLQTSSSQDKVHFNRDLRLKGFRRECIRIWNGKGWFLKLFMPILSLIWSKTVQKYTIVQEFGAVRVLLFSKDA